MKRFEKKAFWRTFLLFAFTFYLLFGFLVILYYRNESARLHKEMRIKQELSLIECKRMQLTTCPEAATTIDTDAIMQTLLYALLWATLFILPVSMLLTRYSLRPYREATAYIDAFIAQVVHDLGAPLTGAKTAIGALIRRSEKSERLQRTKRAIEQIEAMREDLLSLSSEKRTHHPQTIEVKALIETVIAAFAEQHPEIDFISHLEDLKAHVDPNDLRRILQNLIGNALKYNKNDAPITVTCQEGRIIIEDRGRGIASVKKALRLHYREFRDKKGYGIGLSAVMALAQCNNITVEIESELDKGTRVQLLFNTATLR